MPKTNQRTLRIPKFLKQEVEIIALNNSHNNKAPDSASGLFENAFVLYKNSNNRLAWANKKTELIRTNLSIRDNLWEEARLYAKENKNNNIEPASIQDVFIASMEQYLKCSQEKQDDK